MTRPDHELPTSGCGNCVMGVPACPEELLAAEQSFGLEREAPRESKYVRKMHLLLIS